MWEGVLNRGPRHQTEGSAERPATVRMNADELAQSIGVEVMKLLDVPRLVAEVKDHDLTTKLEFKYKIFHG